MNSDTKSHKKANNEQANGESGTENVKTEADWNQGLIKLYTFDTVEDFWGVYKHLQLPAKLRLKNDYRARRRISTHP